MKHQCEQWGGSLYLFCRLLLEGTTGLKTDWIKYSTAALGKLIVCPSSLLELFGK